LSCSNVFKNKLHITIIVAISLATAAAFWWELVKVLKRPGLKASDKGVESNLQV
jgi:hypothetical protein